MPKKIDNKKKADVHEDLQGFDIKIDSFGQMESNMDVNKINEFLNKNVQDRKIEDRKEEE